MGFRAIWDAIRVDVDHTHLAGQYILTGSSTPRKVRPKHSGAGRFGIITMRPMSLYESGDSSGEVSLRSLFEGATSISGSSDYQFEDIVRLCTRGGWPESVVKNPTSPGRIATNYLKTITEREDSFSELEYYSPGRMRALLRSLARSVSGPARISTIISDVATSTGTTISDTTAANYIAILEQNHILDDIEAWSPRLRSKTEIRTSKKRNFIDPSLVVAALYAAEGDLLKDINTLGLVFESLVMRDLRTYAAQFGGELAYYRDKNGLECDAIVHTYGGKWTAIEVKLGHDIDALDAAAENLIKLAGLVDTETMSVPVFLAIVSGTAKRAYRRADGVFVIPVGCLKP